MENDSKYILVVDYKGPESRRSFQEMLLRRPGKLEYVVKLRLYYENLSFLLETFGPYKIIDGQAHQNTESWLEAEIRREFAQGITISGSPLVEPLVPLKDIKIELKKVT